MTLKILQYTIAHDPVDVWAPMSLPHRLLELALALKPGEQLSIGVVNGSETRIVYKPWRHYLMYQVRLGGGKRGVRISEISAAIPLAPPPTVTVIDLLLPGSPLSKGGKTEPLHDPSVTELLELVAELKQLNPEVEGYKFGASGLDNNRRFDSTHYNPQWFDTSHSVVLAVNLTSNRAVQLLEQSCIELDYSVNHNASGLPCEYSDCHPAQIYAVPLHKNLSQKKFWETHISYHKKRLKFGMGVYEARARGIVPTLAQERKQGVRSSHKKGTTHSYPQRGPAVTDETFVRTLISSGLPLDKLDMAFTRDYTTGLDHLTNPILSSMPLPGSEEESVKKELRKLCSGKSLVGLKKFKRIKPIYQEMRKNTV